VNLPDCATSDPSDCTPLRCHWRCATEVIDELISRPGSLSGEEVDHLLELRWKLSQRNDVEGALKLFCDLRLRMEHRHYLAFFRMRRWLENHLFAGVRICPEAPPQFVPVKLDHYCVEAIRRACLCVALRRGCVLLAPRLRFTFREVERSPGHQGSQELTFKERLQPATPA
jgi:hypothetical protein